MQDIIPKLIDADAIIFATPAYFDNVTGRLKNFLDRTNILGNKMEGKVAGIIVVGQADETSWKHTADYLETYCDILKMKVAGRLCAYARKKGDIQKNVNIENDCEDLAKKILGAIDHG